jgi:lysophospholipase L1-like esterase
MIFIDCNNISINKIKELEEILIKNNLVDNVIINYQKSYKSKKIKIKKINNEKKYINFVKKSLVVFLSNTKNMDEVTKYNEKAFIISDFCKGNFENYYNVSISEIPKVIKDFERKKEKKKNNETIKEEKNINQKNKKQDKKIKSKKENKGILKKVFKSIFIILLLILVVAFLVFLIYKNTNNKKETIIDEETSNDYKSENYLFVGDSITYYYETDKFFAELPTVNTGVCGYTTDNIYNNLNELVYIYNPTKIILLIGTNDLISKDSDYIVNKIYDIIIDIKKNRPNAEIYLESIYPINNTDNDKINHDMVSIRNNDTIKEINKELEKLCYSGNCEYVNMYDLLIDENDNLKLEYTEEGLHISDEGYKVITKKLREVLKKE